VVEVKPWTALILLIMATILPSKKDHLKVSFFHKLAIFESENPIFGFLGVNYGFFLSFLAFCFYLWLIIHFFVKERIVSY